MQDLKGSITFGELAEMYLAYAKVNKKSWKRDVSSFKKLLPVFENMRIKDISAFHIEKYKQKRREEVSKASTNREIALLKHMFNLAIMWKKASHNPVREVKLFKERNQRVRFLTEEEIHKLIEYCLPQLKPIVITALTTGMRRGEILKLKWKNVDFERSLITIEETKNDSVRRIPINDFLKEILLNLESRNTNEYVFLNIHKRPYSDIKTAWQKAIKKAGIKDFRFHDLRHTFASYLVMSNVNLKTVQELLGHKSMQMTMRYSHLSGEYKYQAVNILERRLGFNNGHHMDTIEKFEKDMKPEKP
ncbi:Tyrosine recombinase XerD [subsurface metagenome]